MLTVGIRWTDRLIGLASTLILARLLFPDDFGIVAMASVVVGLVDVLLDFGVQVALIQNRDASQTDYDTAWTLRLCQSALAAGIVIAGAPFAAEYFRDSRIADILRVMALTMFIGGLTNIGIVSFQKNMEFGRDFQFFFYRRIAAFIATVGLAMWMRSYWALVFGALAGRCAGVILSYRMHPMRPRISLRGARGMLAFSSWVLVNNIGNYLSRALDQAVVGRRATADVLGAYSLASEISALPSTELLAPLSRVLFPMFVRAKDDDKQLKSAYLLALGVLALIGIPAGVGIALVAREVVLVLLGERWMAAVPFIQVMGFMQIVSAIGYSGGYVLTAAGNVRTPAMMTLSSVALFSVLVFAVFPRAEAQDIALLRLAVALAGFLVYLAVVASHIPGLRFGEQVGSFWRPLTASAAMGGVVLAVEVVTQWPPSITLVAKVGLGALVYVSAVWALWRLSGCPDGAEAYLLGKATGVVARMRGAKA